MTNTDIAREIREALLLRNLKIESVANELDWIGAVRAILDKHFGEVERLRQLLIELRAWMPTNCDGCSWALNDIDAALAERQKGEG